jgi:hypothetical protein
VLLHDTPAFRTAAIEATAMEVSMRNLEAVNDRRAHGL